LLPRVAQERLGVHIHLSGRTIAFDTLGIYGWPTIETKAGHLAISLLDFAAVGHPWHGDVDPMKTLGLSGEEHFKVSEDGMVMDGF
jgi:hypothetical protein